MTNPIREAIAEFYATTNKYARFGAADTEPRAEFALMLRAKIDGEDAQVPQDWYLYSGMAGVKEARAALSEAAQKVLDAIAADPEVLRAAYDHFFAY